MEERGRAFNGWLDSWFYFEVCQLLNGSETLDQLWKLRFRAVSRFLPSCGSTGHKSLFCFPSCVVWIFEKAYYRVPSGVLWEVLLECGVPGLCVNHLILPARGLFVFLASGGHRTETRVLDSPTPVCDIYRPQPAVYQVYLE